MDIICAIRLMDVGELCENVDALSRLARCSKDEMITAIDELATTKTAAISKQNESIIITCRRLKREHDIKGKRAIAGAKGGSKKKAKVQANTQAPSSSSSSSNTNISILEREFIECWAIYPKKSGKTRAEAAYKKAKPEQQDVIDGIARYLDYVDAQRRDGFKDLKYADGGTWFYQQRWLDECEITEKQEEPIDLDAPL